MSQRIDIFISSTSRDLPEHRKQVMDACLRMGMFPIMMEHLPASDADAIEASLKMVDDAEIYLGIFAWRYGYIPVGHDLSITEMEYNRVVERGIPRLIFVMHDDHPVKGSDVEKGVGAEKLEAFKQHLLTEQVVNFYISPEDLRGQVIHSLVPHRVPDPGSLHSRYASEIPLPPEPYVAHPYTLLQTSDLIGRKKELAMLTEWATQSAAPVFNFVVAIGGMGKSALTWKWFNDIAPTVMPHLAGRMWWSFYESDASFENFVIRALAYVSQRSKEEIEEIPPSDREARLLALLDKEPFLLVWDGFERTMLAYTRMDAARMTDDDLDEKTANFVVDTMGLPARVAQSFLGKHQLRKTADPRIGTFLRKLVRVTKSRVLVSSRLYPAELQSEAGQTLPGSHAYFLRGLEDEDALTLWQAFDVSGSPDTLLPMFRTFENYPLLIRALAGEVAGYRKTPGDFEAWRRAYPDFNPFKLPIMQVKSHVLLFALQGLDESAHKLLHTIAAFRMPATYDTLAALLVGKERTFTSERELDMALNGLEDRGLVGWDKRANRYDLHPVVRGVVWDRVENAELHNLYQSLEKHFQTFSYPIDDNIKSFDDLSPSVELFNALIQLKKYDEAFEIFYERIFRFTSHNLAASLQQAQLLEMLFPDGTDNPPPLSLAHMRGYTLFGLATAYKRSGYPQRAVPFYRRQMAGDEKVGDIQGVSIGLGNLAHTLLLIGDLYEAELSVKQGLMINRRQRDNYFEVENLLWFSQIVATRGRLDLADKALLRVQKMPFRPRGLMVESLVGAIENYLSQEALLKGLFDIARILAENTCQMERSRRFARDYIVAMKIQGQAALGMGNITQADELLHNALKLVRSANLIEEEISIVITVSEIKRRQGDINSARNFLIEIQDFLKRAPYPSFHADTLNILAQIERDEGHTAAAIAAATQAYEKAWCDGPPYAYHWGLEVARKHLDELGAPYPSMPPFDPSKYEPMPEVEINPPDEFHV